MNPKKYFLVLCMLIVSCNNPELEQLETQTEQANLLTLVAIAGSSNTGGSTSSTSSGSSTNTGSSSGSSSTSTGSGSSTGSSSSSSISILTSSPDSRLDGSYSNSSFGEYISFLGSLNGIAIHPKGLIAPTNTMNTTIASLMVSKILITH
ncbi:MAG: hypothetical protein AAF518_15885 [Spirochaetota bacterium]